MSSEETSAHVASLAARGLTDPSSLTPEEVRQVCASALTQSPDVMSQVALSSVQDGLEQTATAPSPVSIDQVSLVQKAAIVIRSLLRESYLSDHIVTPHGGHPIVASNLVTELEAL